MKQPLAIFCSDIHFREDIPICRKDDFLQTQISKMRWLSELQKEYNVPIYHSGDLLHKWKVNPYLISLLLEILPDDFYSVYGNHSLKHHSLKLEEQSGEYTLVKAGRLKLLKEGHYGQDLTNASGITLGNNKILITHTLVWKGGKPFPNCKSPSATGFLRKHFKFDCIVTGDNHIPFTQELDGRLLVNSGSFTRQRTSETHEPRVYLYYSDNTVEPIFVPIEKNVISIEHLSKIKNRDKRLSAFISSLNKGLDIEFSFEDNVNRLLESVDDNVKDYVSKAMEER